MPVCKLNDRGGKKVTITSRSRRGGSNEGREYTVFLIVWLQWQTLLLFHVGKAGGGVELEVNSRGKRMKE